MRKRVTAALKHAGALLAMTAVLGAATPSDTEPQPLFRIEDTRIDESSGVVLSSDGDVVFTLEDAGKAAAVYAVDLTGKTRLTLELPGSTNEDWEDIDRGVDEQGRPALFIADTGDAFFVRDESEGPRTEFAVLRVPEPDVDLDASALTTRATEVTRYRLEYDDGRARNSEALAVQPRTNRVILVDKTKDTTETPYVWAAPRTLSAGDVNKLVRVAQVPVREATAAAFSPGGDLFVVRNYRSAYIWPVQRDALAVALRERPVVIPLPPQRQGEGLTFTGDGKRLILSSEGPESLVWEVPVPADIRPSELLAEPQAAASEKERDNSALWIVGAAALGVLLIGGAEAAAIVRRRARVSD